VVAIHVKSPLSGRNTVDGFVDCIAPSLTRLAFQLTAPAGGNLLPRRCSPKASLKRR
jgi:hypothetical protein